MAEAPYTGLTASIKVGPKESATPLAYISGFSLSLSKDMIEILAFGMQYKEKVPAIKDWSASVDGTCALAEGGSQAELYTAFESGEPLTIGVYLNDTTYFEGTAYVSSFDIDGSPDDAITVSAELAGSGAVLLTLPEA